MLEAPTALLERYRRALWDTTAYVVSKLSHKAAPARDGRAMAEASWRMLDVARRGTVAWDDEVR